MPFAEDLQGIYIALKRSFFRAEHTRPRPVGIGELLRGGLAQHGLAIEKDDAALVWLVWFEPPISGKFKRFDVSNLLDRYEYATDGDNVVHGWLHWKMLRDGNS